MYIVGVVLAQTNPDRSPTNPTAVFDVEYEDPAVEGSWVYHVDNLYKDYLDGTLIVLD